MAKKTDNIVEENVEEVSEEVVQAVANAIVEEAEEKESDVETIVNEIVEESKENDVQENLDEKETEKESLDLEEEKIVHNSTLDYRSRGFKTEKDARNFVKTDYFKNLGEADKEEFMAWLKN